MKKILIAVLCILIPAILVSCASAGSKTPVTLASGGATQGFNTIEEAVAAIPEGGEGTITVSADTAITTPIVLGDKTVTITDAG